MDLPTLSLPPRRVLMGPGPSDVPSAVLAALARPTVGHMDPAFLSIMDQIRALLRPVLGTDNELTLPMSGTGSAGMETLLVNLVEPGDRVLVGVHGVFGRRMAEVARRAGAEVSTVEVPWGRPLDPDALRRATSHGRPDLMCVVHAETSTGVLQSLDGLGAMAHEAGALFLVDAVTSVGGVPVLMDRYEVDALYTGTQKCLSCPPGLAPISLSERAWSKIHRRKQPVQSWYLDLSLITRYWGGERAYHHTAPVNMLYALHEALRLVHEEGLEARYQRHRDNAAALRAGLEAMGLQLPVPAEARLDPLTLVEVPDGVDDAVVRRTMLSDYGIEIGGGLGDFAGRAFRIGLMGAASTRRNVTLCLAALTDVLGRQGFSVRDDALLAATEAWSSEAARVQARA